MTPQEFAAQIKAKHPGYADIPDDVLVAKVLAKYPQYQDQVEMAAPARDPRADMTNPEIQARIAAHREALGQMGRPTGVDQGEPLKTPNAILSAAYSGHLPRGGAEAQQFEDAQASGAITAATIPAMEASAAYAGPWLAGLPGRGGAAARFILNPKTIAAGVGGYDLARGKSVVDAGIDAGQAYLTAVGAGAGAGQMAALPGRVGRAGRLISRLMGRGAGAAAPEAAAAEAVAAREAAAAAPAPVAVRPGAMSTTAPPMSAPVPPPASPSALMARGAPPAAPVAAPPAAAPPAPPVAAQAPVAAASAPAAAPMRVIPVEVPPLPPRSAPVAAPVAPRGPTPYDPPPPRYLGDWVGKRPGGSAVPLMRPGAAVAPSAAPPGSIGATMRGGAAEARTLDTARQQLSAQIRAQGQQLGWGAEQTNLIEKAAGEVLDFKALSTVTKSKAPSQLAEVLVQKYGFPSASQAQKFIGDVLKMAKVDMVPQGLGMGPVVR